MVKILPAIPPATIPIIMPPLQIILAFLIILSAIASGKKGGGILSFFKKFFSFITGGDVPTLPRERSKKKGQKSSPSLSESSASLSYSTDLRPVIRPLRNYTHLSKAHRRPSILTKELLQEEERFKEYLRRTGRPEEAADWDELMREVRKKVDPEVEDVEMLFNYYWNVVLEEHQKWADDYDDYLDRVVPKLKKKFPDWDPPKDDIKRIKQHILKRKPLRQGPHDHKVAWR